jgi:hypothetical protein
MREYKLAMQEEKVLSKVICNGCGKEIPWETADHFHGEKTWGYFSGKDGRQRCCRARRLVSSLIQEADYVDDCHFSRRSCCAVQFRYDPVYGHAETTHQT